MRKWSDRIQNWGIQQRYYLYDLIFPFFILIFFPPVILLTLVGNYIVDAAVIWISLSANSVQLGKKKMWKLITISWVLGLVADIGGVILLMAFTGGNSHIYTIWDDRTTSITFISVVVLCGFLIGILNYHLCNRRRIAKGASLCVSLSMAVITAPWTFLLPTSWFIHI